MHPAADWPPVLDRADRAVVDVLCRNGLGLDYDRFHQEFITRLQQYYTKRDSQQIETSISTVLSTLLQEKGFNNLPPALLRAALDARYRVSQSNWNLVDDAHQTLATLRANGLKLGIVSNAGDNKDVFQLVDKFGIALYFDFILTSASCGRRKPHPRIFEIALTHWNYPPNQVAMVGDRLDTDIAGANQIGIFSIWYTRYAKKPTKIKPEPRAQITQLTEISNTIQAL